jgi:hypothetical protein
MWPVPRCQIFRYEGEGLQSQTEKNFGRTSPPYDLLISSRMTSDLKASPQNTGHGHPVLTREFSHLEPEFCQRDRQVERNLDMEEWQSHSNGSDQCWI